MNYIDAVSYIDKSFGSVQKKGFKIFGEILETLGNPQKKLKIIHVAGTNGKGSISVMINNVLINQGYKVGLFTSPHMEKYNERLKINNQLISDEELSHQVTRLKKATNQYFNNEEDSLYFFEVFTALAFMYFNDEKVDFVILEAGIGGGRDSTNIIEEPILSVITSISLDHIEILGNTLVEIAEEKAGIIKENCPLALYLQNEEVYNKINDIAIKKNSKVFHSNSDSLYIDIVEMDLEKTVFNVKHDEFSYDNVEISLLGEYQVYNSICVLLAVAALKDQKVLIEDEAVYKALANTKWSGRMEILKVNDKTILFEGAHNLDAILNLKKSLKTYFDDKNIILVIGVLEDKDYQNMINVITVIPDMVILTSPDSARAMNPEDIKQLDNTNIIIEHDYKKAIDKALEVATKDDLICVTGSLYLIGDIKKYLG